MLSSSLQEFPVYPTSDTIGQQISLTVVKSIHILRKSGHCVTLLKTKQQRECANLDMNFITNHLNYAHLVVINQKFEEIPKL